MKDTLSSMYEKPALHRTVFKLVSDLIVPDICTIRGRLVDSLIMNTGVEPAIATVLYLPTVIGCNLEVVTSFSPVWTGK